MGIGEQQFFTASRFSPTTYQSNGISIRTKVVELLSFVVLFRTIKPYERTHRHGLICLPLPLRGVL